MMNMANMTKPSFEGRMKPAQTRGTDQTPQRIPGRRERRKLATRDALLDAARSLLVSRSMDALGVDEIVERADVARGTFYNYFADKDALERELASQSRARIEGEIARVNEGVSDAAERIARAFLSVLHLGISAPQQATAMMRLFPRATDPAAPINSGVRRDAAEGMTQGRIVATSEDAVVACVMGVFTAGVNRALDLPAGRVREFAQGLGTILLHGLGLKRAEAERIMRAAIEAILPRE
jgi:AcrR family transcriptional regulator